MIIIVCLFSAPMLVFWDIITRMNVCSVVNGDCYVVEGVLME